MTSVKLGFVTVGSASVHTPAPAPLLMPSVWSANEESGTTVSHVIGLVSIPVSAVRLVSVMTIQEARYLNKRKENSLPVLNVDMKLRKPRILACQRAP